MSIELKLIFHALLSALPIREVNIEESQISPNGLNDASFHVELRRIHTHRYFVRLILVESRHSAVAGALRRIPNEGKFQHADLVFDIQSGLEKAVAATKTYTAQLMAIAMISAALAGDESLWRELENVPAWVEQVLMQDDPIARMAQRYRYMHLCVVLGRGFNYATAFEWALKLKELTYVVAEPYSSADFQHGPIAMIEGGFPVLAVAPSGLVFETMLGMLTNLRHKHDAELVVISDDDRALELAQSPLRLPAGVSEWLTPLVSIVPAQLFACHLTLAKGYDTDQPRGLDKVTRTR